MKITPMTSAGNAIGAVEGSSAPQSPNLRSLKMSTLATPGRLEDGPSGQELPISEVSNNTEETTSAEATQPISPQLALIARQKRALQVKERELLDREKAVETKLQGGDYVSKARLKSETLKVFEESGISWDDLTQAILSGQGNSEVKALEAKIKALEEGVDKRFTDQSTQAEQQVLAEMQREAKNLVAEGDTFELVRETGSVPDVMKLIERTYKETGEVLEVSEALQLVEDEILKRNQKLVSLKKMQGLFQPQTPPVQQRPQGMRTLTNKDTASAPMSAKARALAAALGTLKR